LEISDHTPHRLEAKNWRGASSFTVFTFTLCLPLSFHSCARYFFTILSRSRCHFLAHAFSLTFCFAFLLMFSLVRGVLPRVLFSPSLIVFCGFIHSIFAFSSFNRFRLGWFSFTGFVLTIYKRYVFLSLYAWNAFWMFVS